ncbi:hypothetical protein DWB85_14935 [Seongchinamella sediminis]|uniref:Alginate export domain-containing protein n=1 Tax=Seongchinamella sediminis TaxID=2283635 RepID=A0A3L7DUE2_9GAMM|nr:hypothetical protein [Seongchinamella sediminis]RLQ21014.1 hypothetical protein DWB85_14935 [Seongchinamella sediminis]
MKRLCGALLLAACSAASAELLQFRSGHAKAQYQAGSYPDDSLLRELIGTPGHDVNGDLRLLVDGARERFSWQADYQLIARSGDSLELNRALQGTLFAPAGELSDDRRLLDLTDTISDGDDYSLVQRLDRLHAGYTGDQAVLRIGRQAISWGNGLMYNPVDFFNPFDPAAVDKEYKSGDDMLYGQYLQDNGNDIELVAVWRRDADGNTGSDVNTQTLKYHAFVGAGELDLVAARHYRDNIVSVGGLTDLGGAIMRGAILRGDVLLTDTELDTYAAAVINLSYSWIGFGRNMSGVVEYFFNGMGLRQDDYRQLPQQQDLVARLARGELFTIGRHYLAGGVSIELSPLFMATPNLFYNLGDSSGLVQLVAQYDLAQDWQLLVAGNIPFGASGTEFGGLDTGVDDLQLASGPSLFAQLAFYF